MWKYDCYLSTCKLLKHIMLSQVGITVLSKRTTFCMSCRGEIVAAAIPLNPTLSLSLSLCIILLDITKVINYPLSFGESSLLVPNPVSRQLLQPFWVNYSSKCRNNMLTLIKSYDFLAPSRYVLIALHTRVLIRRFEQVMPFLARSQLIPWTRLIPL